MAGLHVALPAGEHVTIELTVSSAEQHARCARGASCLRPRIAHLQSWQCRDRLVAEYGVCNLHIPQQGPPRAGVAAEWREMCMQPIRTFVKTQVSCMLQQSAVHEVHDADALPVSRCQPCRHSAAAAAAARGAAATCAARCSGWRSCCCARPGPYECGRRSSLPARVQPTAAQVVIGRAKTGTLPFPPVCAGRCRRQPREFDGC
jgi:hypothetical protein